MSPSSPVSVKAGSFVSLECVAEGKPTPDVQWETQLKSHSSLQLGERGRGVSKLVIETVGPEDEGSYTCQAQNIVGKTQETVQLIGKFVVRPVVIQVIILLKFVSFFANLELDIKKGHRTIDGIAH